MIIHPGQSASRFWNLPWCSCPLQRKQQLKKEQEQENLWLLSFVDWSMRFFIYQKQQRKRPSISFFYLFLAWMIEQVSIRKMRSLLLGCCWDEILRSDWWFDWTTLSLFIALLYSSANWIYRALKQYGPVLMLFLKRNHFRRHCVHSARMPSTNLCGVIDRHTTHAYKRNGIANEKRGLFHQIWLEKSLIWNWRRNVL